MRDHRLLIVVITAVFAVAANRISHQIRPSYSAQASVALGNLGQDATLAGLPASNNEQLPSQTPAVNAETITSPQIVNAVVTRLRRQHYSGVTAAALRNALSARVEAQSNLVVLQVSSSNPRFAQAAVNGMANEDVTNVTQQEHRQFQIAADALRSEAASVRRSSSDQASRAAYAQQIARLRSLTQFGQGAQVAQYARQPATASSPSPTRDTILAGLVGLTLAIIVAFMRSSLDRRVRSAAEIQHELGMSLLSRVAASAMGRAATSPNGRKRMTVADLEAFRILRANLDFLAPDQELVVIAVTSPLAQEGKTTVAMSLAWASCWAGRHTLLIEADLRRPSVAKRTGLQRKPGLGELLDGTATLDQAVQRMPDERPEGADTAARSDNGDQQADEHHKPAPASLDVITAGNTPEMPAELLGSPQFRELLDEARQHYDAVILDTAPLLPVADTLKVLPHVDGVLICVRVARTRGDELRAAREALERLPRRPVGLVVTGVRRGDEADYGYYPPARAMRA